MVMMMIKAWTRKTMMIVTTRMMMMTMILMMIMMILVMMTLMIMMISKSKSKVVHLYNAFSVLHAQRRFTMTSLPPADRKHI